MMQLNIQRSRTSAQQLVKMKNQPLSHGKTYPPGENGQVFNNREITVFNLQPALIELVVDLKLKGYLHAPSATFIPVRVHSGFLLWLCICLHDTSTETHNGVSQTGASSPRSLYWSEIFIPIRNSLLCHVNAVQLFAPAGNHSPGSLERVAHA